MKTFVAVVVMVVIGLLSGLTWRRSGSQKPRRSRGPARRATTATAATRATNAGAARATRRVPVSAPAAAEPVASEQYAASAALLHLAVIVCTADEAMSASERRLLDEHVERAPGLNEGERSELAEHLDALLESKPNFRGVKKRLASLDAPQRVAIADFLIGVAGADGEIAPEEIRLLGKIYPMLGLAAEEVYSRIHAMAAGASPDTASHAPSAGASLAGEPGAVEPSAGRAQPIRLNMTTVQQKLAQSAQVSAILGDIFSEQGDEPETR